MALYDRVACYFKSVPIVVKVWGISCLSAGITALILFAGWERFSALSSIARLLVASGLAVAGGTAVSLVLLRFITHPLRDLCTSTSRLRDGDFGARAPVYAQDEIGHLAAVFNETAAALQRYRETIAAQERSLRNLLKKIVNTHEEERSRVARDLHDEIGQALSRLLLVVRLNHENCKALPSACRNLEEEIQNIIRDTRRLAYALRPPLLQDYGLPVALERLVQDTAQRSGISFKYHCLLPLQETRLPTEWEITLYRIAQEALTNVIRHSHASSATLLLLHDDSTLRLIVEDDGRGFDTAALHSPETYPLGLMGMRERAELLGGSLHIESTPGHGTTVVCSLPLPSAAPSTPSEAAHSPGTPNYAEQT